MSTPIPTYNIIVAFDKDVFTDLKRSSVDSLDAFFRNRKDSVLFTNIADNFIRLAHTYSFQEKQGKETDNFTLTLEILDPGKVFEQNYLANSLKQLFEKKSSVFSTQDIVKNTDLEIKAVTDDLAQIEKNPDDFALNSKYSEYTSQSVEKELYDLRKALREQKEPVRGNPDQSNPDIDSSESEYEFKERLDTFSKNKEKLLAQFQQKRQDYIGELSVRLNELQNPKNKTDIFISYGCGSNLDNWAGPFLCFMTGANFGFSAETGFRTITLIFTVNAQWPGLTPTDVMRFNLGKDLQVFGTHPIVKISKKDDGGLPVLVTQESDRLAALMAGSRKPKVEVQSEETFIDYHYVISECIKDYIIKCTNDNANVIVLFPDLNELIIPFKNNLASAFNYSPFNTPYEYCEVELEDGSRIQVPKTEFYIIPEVFKQLGFDVTEEIVQNGKVISYSNDANIGKLGAAQFYSEAVKDWTKTGKNLYLSLVKKPGQTYIDPLNVLKNNFPLTTRVIEPVMFVENNIDFLKDLKNFCKEEAVKENNRRSSLNKYDISVSKRLQEIISIDEKKPLILYGDRTMLERYFYGKIRLEEIGLFKFGFGKDSNLAEAQQSQSDANQNDRFFNYKNLIATRDLKFATPEYQKIAEKYFQLAKNDNCFNSYKVPTSQFAFTESDADKLEKSNIPIFKFGVQDSNVLDMDMNIDQYYFNMLASVFWQTTSLFKSGTGAKDSTSDVFNALLQIDAKQMAKYINEYMIIKPGSPPKLDPNKYKQLKGIPQLAAYSEKDLEAVFVSLMTLTENKNQVRNLDWWKSENPAIHFYSLLSQMSKSAYRGTIRTLPFFHLSTSVGSLNPALLFVKETSILGVNKNSSISDSLNGLWVIYGYEHSINKGGAHSMFHITKDPRIQLPATLIPESKNDSPTTKVADPKDS